MVFRLFGVNSVIFRLGVKSPPLKSSVVDQFTNRHILCLDNNKSEVSNLKLPLFFVSDVY